jgi:hypothetical protein
MSEEKCVVCRRRDPETGTVCEADILALTAMLAELPGKLARLPLMLIPGQSTNSERVTASRVEAPTPTRDSALNLLGPGSIARPSPQHPKIRTWTEKRTVAVTFHGPGGTEITEERELIDFCREPVTDPETGKPVLVADDDQIGVIPPAAWLEQQATAWRRIFGHRLRPATQTRAPRPRTALHWSLTRLPTITGPLIAARTIESAHRAGAAQLITGNEPGHAGARPDSAREDDPIADLWRIRFGQQELWDATGQHLNYLITWLSKACDHTGIDMAAFATQLRAITSEIIRVLEEKPDQLRLGRCPATITDRTSGARRVCGVDLWQDPHASVIQCAYCRSTWGPRGIDVLRLASEIRTVWPLDARRRYSAEETGALRPVLCPACAEPIEISWRDVTGSHDEQRWWKPVGTRCPDGCRAGGEIL